MADLKNVVYISNADYETLITNGSVTVNGTTVTYDPNDLYITPEEDLNIISATGAHKSYNGSSPVSVSIEDLCGIATTSTAGLVKSSNTGTTANRDYKVQVNSDGTMKVNVPWNDTNTAAAADNILHGSNNGTQITYAPYAAQQSKLSFDTSTTAPTRTDRLNLNGYLYATKFNVAGKAAVQYNSTEDCIEFIFA